MRQRAPQATQPVGFSREREMKDSRSILLIAVPLIAAVAAFWLLAISPKRQEAADLETRASDLQSQVDEQAQLAANAEAARRDFPRAYRRVVVLGKAAPEDDDTSSLLVQLNRIASESDVDFISLENAGGGGTAPASSAPASPEASADSAQPEQQVENGDIGAAAPSPATEASAALLPIGAAIGPAGLPVMKYTLTFDGDFFRLADFLSGLDDLVQTRKDGTVGVQGRLITVDGFDLTSLDATGADGSEESGLSATFTITTFLTPAEEGVTGGASPTGPAPVTEPQPASTAPATDPTATASTTAP